MTTDPLAPDCGRCAALCCLALDLVRGAAFAIDKPAGEPCRHLGAGHACTLHGRLALEGFCGCAGYTCHGAGQAVVQAFGGRSWRDDPALAGPMIQAFARLREVHDLAAQLTAAEPFADEVEASARRLLLAALLPAAGWSERRLAAFDLPAARAEFRRILLAIRAALATPGVGAMVAAAT